MRNNWQSDRRRGGAGTAGGDGASDDPRVLRSGRSVQVSVAPTPTPTCSMEGGPHNAATYPERCLTTHTTRQYAMTHGRRGGAADRCLRTLSCKTHASGAICMHESLNVLRPTSCRRIGFRGTLGY